MNNTYIQIYNDLRLSGINAILDVDQSVKFPLNFAVSDIRDLTKKTGAFSKSITLPGTANNNQIFNFLFDVNAYTTSTSFDINKKVKCMVVQEGNIVLDNAVLQLVSVDKSSTSMINEERITYTVLITDNTIDLYSLIDQQKIVDLGWSEYNHEFSAENVALSWSNTYLDGYKYILYQNMSDVYSLPEIKPGIYVKTIMDKIFKQNGYSYTWPASSNSLFEKLIMPYNGPEIKNDAGSLSTIVNYINPQSSIFIPGVNAQNVLLTPNVIQDPPSSFDIGSNTYTNTYAYAAGQNLKYYIVCDYEIYLRNTETYPINFVVNSSNPDPLTLKPSFTIGNLKSHIVSVPINTLLQPGDTLIASSTNKLCTINVPAPGYNDSYQIYYGLTSNGFTTANDIEGGLYFIAEFQAHCQLVTMLTNVSVTIEPEGIPGYLSIIDMNSYVPDMLQSDFLSSLFTMFNIYAVTDTTNPNRLLLYHRNEFYDNGVVKDWSSKLDKSSTNNLRFLPELTSKRLTLRYKQDKDPANEAYFKKTNTTYGQVTYVYDNEFIKNEDYKEVQFGPSPFFKTSFDAYVLMLNGASPDCNPRVLIDSGEVHCNTFRIINYLSSGGVQMPPGATGPLGTYTLQAWTYPLCTHFDDPDAPTFDLNFGVADFYGVPGQQVTFNNLGETYWRRTIKQINSGSMFTCYLALTSADIQNLSLSDTIYLDNTYWNINQIIDYDATSNSLTKVELITVDPLQSNY